MKWIMLPALISLLIKFTAIYVCRKNWEYSNTFFYLIASIAAQNVTELLLFIDFFTGSVADFTLRSYYVCTIMMFAFLIAYATEISNLNSLKSIPIYSYFTSGILSTLIVFTNLVVSGFFESYLF